LPAARDGVSLLAEFNLLDWTRMKKLRLADLKFVKDGRNNKPPENSSLGTLHQCGFDTTQTQHQYE
jgi:hypothetical protein